ncbi:FHA domain protein [compost metagenome]
MARRRGNGGMQVKATAESAQSRSGRPIGLILIDVMIVIIVLQALFYAYFINDDRTLQWMTGIAGAAVLLIWIIAKQRRKAVPGRTNISKLVLLDEEGERLKEWYISGETSLLVGKSSGRSEVDIDLTDAEYASLISPQHAVLNYASGKWYIEDLDSRNGIGLRKYNRSTVNRLDNEKPHRIDAGDLILIANTRLLVK